jgi:hypothetical protein
VNVVLFPDVFEKHVELLRSEGPLVLAGTLQIETERAELHVEDAVPIEDAWGRLTEMLCIRLAADRVNGPVLVRLRTLLDPVPGDVPVCLEIALPNGTEAVLGLERHRVAVTRELVAEIERLFGGPVVECRAAY